jgi:hypothetical protein
MHFLMLAENNTYSVEPRLSMKYEFLPQQFISFGYGLHGQMQPLGVYFLQYKDQHGNITTPNHDLEFTKAHHFVLAYDRMLGEQLRMKTELYYQHLYNVPVSVSQNSTYSILNQSEGYTNEVLGNNGKGRNVGLELTLEQFMKNDLYFLLSGSVFDSKYEAANGEWYDTRFNCNYNFSLTGGKEIKTGSWLRNRVAGFNLKAVYSGGMRETPLNAEKSAEAGYAVYHEDRPFSDKVNDYFRADIHFSLKRNRPKSTITWALDIQNASSTRNVYGRYFDPLTSRVKTAYQAPLIPILSYKIEF